MFEAKKLEEECLKFINSRMNEVVKTSSFGLVSQKWPEVMLKISICVAGVSESCAGAAMEAQQNAAKRKPPRLLPLRACI